MAQAVDSKNRPNMKEFMDATGVDASAASEILYGTIGANTDQRDWKAIMASGDPVQAAIDANLKQYSDGSATKNLDAASYPTTFVNPVGNKAGIVKTETGYALVSSDGVPLRAGFNSLEQAQSQGKYFGITDFLGDSQEVARPVSSGQPSQPQPTQPSQPLATPPVPEEVKQIVPNAVNIPVVKPTYGQSPMTPQGIIQRPESGTFSSPLQTAGLSAVPDSIMVRPNYTGTTMANLTLPSQGQQNIQSVMYSNDTGQTVTVTEINGQPTTYVPPGFKRMSGQTLPNQQPKEGGEPETFNKGGLAMERQMNTMMAEGGIKDSGMNRDPISGNEIPAGSLAKEVRDDVDAKLSEGEYVVPADVVRYFGVNYFEKLRQKAKAGLEEMDKDGRIGGDPVGAPMGDMDEALSDEEMFALNEMFKGGFVTSAGYQEGGSVTPSVNNQGFTLPQSVFAPTPATAPAATPTTLYGPSGDVITLMLPAEQQRYNQLISEGYSTKPVEAPTTGGEKETRSDRDRSAIATPQVTGGEGFNPFALDEEEANTLSNDPLAFGMSALDRNSLVGSRGAGVVGGAVGGPMGLLAGAGFGGLLELQDLAKARASLIVAKDKGLSDTEGYAKLEEEIKDKEKGLNRITKFIDNLAGDFFSGESLAKSLQTPAATVGAATPQAIPTGSVTTPSSGSSSGSDSSSDSPYAPTRSIRPIARPDRPTTPSTGSTQNDTSSATSAARSRVDAGGTAGIETTEQKLKRGGGFDKGGLVQRPKKKPVAKK